MPDTQDPASPAATKTAQTSGEGMFAPHALAQEQIARYHKDGYVIIPGLFMPEEVEPLRRACEDDPDIRGSQVSYADTKGKTVSMATWTELGDSLLGVFPRMARLVDAAEALLGGRPVYHWHSKLVKKDPRAESSIEWHQGYGAWYHDGCLFPDLVSCAVAVTHSNRQNGCLQVIKRSHLLGRVNHVLIGEAQVIDPHRMERILEKLELVHCEVEPGDVVLFHANTIHGSVGNDSDAPRILLHCHYNAVENAPFWVQGQEHHRYKPLVKMPDNAIKDGLYSSIFDNHPFHAPEKGQGQGRSIVRRGANDDSDSRTFK